ncbi:type ISP restriction/modification enzyme [Sphingorhabdus sp.]|jgi:predicted helicase|uniref:type ISP restriction/modification enzyme n=1 Tax=Sphingorhabdus sp. TaxID=1902408 RepID=UPI003783E054
MSRQLINEYRADLDRLRQVSGSRRESVVREPFKELLKRWGKSQDLHFVAEHAIVTPKGNRIYTDGALLHRLGVPFGYWEAKDQDDKLDREITDKFRKGYPKTNILFSDDVTAVLFQDGHEQMRAAMDDSDALLPLLARFFGRERPEVRDFKKAVRQFAIDLPDILTALRDIIQKKRKESKDFARAQDDFLKHARDTINPAVTDADVQEMLIQHILTEDIFAKVFENPDFHRQNNVAAALYALEDKLFGYGEKQRLLKALQPYYAGISATAAVIDSHTEKQGFLKGLYENFYKVYNPMAADRLGVVYTPGEIVRFMIKSADWLCETHFDRNLIDKGVEILDPATGTGTFIVELLESFRTGGGQEQLRFKYKNELHANEVAILPYYVANLNIEATYAAITGQFAEYPNLCFVDTLDNVKSVKGIKDATHVGDLFGGMSTENMERIKRQNERKISVFIGNPPYNANQQNENDNNKNLTYPFIDANIKATYIKESTAQKTKLYDMYARFFRWATDRLGENDGIIAFITNRSFIESRTFDGFRKMVAQDFNEIWVIDLGGDVRANPKLSGTKHNVFGIQTGVAICYLVRKKRVEGCTIRYIRRPEDDTAEDKLSWLGGADLKSLPMIQIKPDARHDWISQREKSEWDDFLPIANRETKAASDKRDERAIFKLYSLGVVTARDDWVYGWQSSELDNRLPWFIEKYEGERKRLAALAKDEKLSKAKRREAIAETDIKLTRAVKNDLAANIPYEYDEKRNRKSLYRPFVAKQMHYWARLNEMQYQTHRLFVGVSNPTLMVSGVPAAKPAQILASDMVPSYDTLEKTECLSRFRYTKSGERVDNITDWAIVQFAANYGSDLAITKDAIFAYCYAVLHDPLYRDKYALNLKREFPRIPFYPDFDQWVEWGKALLKLHIDYENVKPAKLTRIDTPAPKRAEGTHPKPKLRSNQEAGNIVIDDDTQLTGVPVQAWQYRLGNRSAIDWVLDQHKEKTPRDPTIREKFNTYRFADYKESCIELLGKVVKVSVDTVAITEAMKALDRSA